MTRLLPHTALGSLLLALSACGKGTPPSRDPSPADGSAAAVAPAVATAPSAPSALPEASASASASALAATDAGAPPAAAEDAGAAAVVADNKVPPSDGPELQARARGLFEAIVKDEPERAEAFWFPKEPFIPLKDVKDPAKYWTQLHKTYANDVHALHQKRKSWEGAEFVRFDGWVRSKWVPPGDEANKIGYHRAFHGKLHYKVAGEDADLDVQTIITWQGRWYVTHLRKFKK
jgi:hypothetical protein